MYEGCIWEITAGEDNEMSLSRYAGTNSDFPFSRIVFDLDQLVGNRRIIQNPAYNTRNGGAIALRIDTDHDLPQSVNLLHLLAEIVQGERIEEH